MVGSGGHAMDGQEYLVKFRVAGMAILVMNRLATAWMMFVFVEFHEPPSGSNRLRIVACVVQMASGRW